MELASAFERAAAVDLSGADRAGVVQVLRSVARLRCWLDAREAACVHRLSALADAPFPEVEVAEATRDGMRHARHVVQRTATLEVFGRFAKALEAGEVTGVHVDGLTAGFGSLPVEKRGLLAADEDRLLDVARRVTPESFAKAVRETVKRVLSDEDARARLRRQQSAARLRWWTNRTTGMVELRGSFDPETGAEVLARLESARKQLFPDPKALPDTTPSDPGEREDHLYALTLAQLLLGSDAPGWRPEVLLVIDDDTLRDGYHDKSIVDVGADVDLPHEALQRLAARGRIVTVRMRRGVVTSVGGRGNLNLGRTSRLASVDQRRALRAMYPTCAIPDCPVRFRHCQVHHVEPWDLDGVTDLDRLVPICNHHHDAVHNRGWTIELDHARNLTVSQPDGTVTITPPPYAFAA